MWKPGTDKVGSEHVYNHANLSQVPASKYKNIGDKKKHFAIGGQAYLLASRLYFRHGKE